MAECDVCGEEMRTARSCALATIVVSDRKRKRLPYGAETMWPGARSTKPCRDCGVHLGGAHHPGCAVEQCPVCAAQLFCCDCEKWEPRRIGNRRP